MIGGQMIDIESENKKINLETLKYIHKHKTGKLIKLPIEIACIIADVSEDKRLVLEEYAELIGLAFQVKDDILDILENSNIMKKSQYYSKYSDIITKENIEEILNILENIIYENSMIYNSIYRIIIETRRRVKINCNFEMTKDYLILNIWDEINK